MHYEKLESLARARNWDDLEQEWLRVIDLPAADPARLLPIIDSVVEANAADRAATMGWAWLSSMKQSHSADEALRLGRGLLIRLPDGEELREEILTLYKVTHDDKPDLEKWIDRSGLKAGKSVRRAMRFLENGLRLHEGVFLVHRTEDQAAEIVDFDFDDDRVEINTGRRRATLDIEKLVDDYDIADENDFRVLSQLRAEHLQALILKEPVTVAVGILRSHHNQIDRDELKLLLVPRYLDASKWSDWWGKIRNAVKKSPNLRIEGRSPMFLIYDEVGQTLEREVWDAFSKADSPREWLDLFEGYLRDVKLQKRDGDPEFLDRAQNDLVRQIERFQRHKEPSHAFATALVIERLAEAGLPISTDAHGMAITMLQESGEPVDVLAHLPDARLWGQAIKCVEQAFPETWPQLFAELILHAPASLTGVLAKSVEKAGQGELLAPIVDRVLADPGRYTEALMWIWKGPKLKTELPIPAPIELLNLILGLVGPARMSEGKTSGQTISEMRAKVRTGLTAKDYGQYRKCFEGIGEAMAQTIRRQVERADGLGPKVQEEMTDVLRANFPMIYVKPRPKMWEDESVLYFSRKGYDKRKAELDEIVNVKMRENAKAIGEAAARGDLSENSEYKYALEERDLLRARVARLNYDMSLAKVLEPEDVPTDHVSIGQTLTMRPTAGGDPIKLQIMGAGDSDASQGIYSYQTPVAQLIVGKKTGEKVTLLLEGIEAEYVIENIESAVR